MKKKTGDSIFWGILLIIVGVLFLLRNLDMGIDVVKIFKTYWPLLLVVIGLKNIISNIGDNEKN